MQSAQKRPRQKLTGLNDPRIVPYVMILPFAPTCILLHVQSHTGKMRKIRHRHSEERRCSAEI